MVKIVLPVLASAVCLFQNVMSAPAAACTAACTAFDTAITAIAANTETTISGGMCSVNAANNLCKPFTDNVATWKATADDNTNVNFFMTDAGCYCPKAICIRQCDVFNAVTWTSTALGDGADQSTAGLCTTDGITTTGCDTYNTLWNAETAKVTSTHATYSSTGVTQATGTTGTALDVVCACATGQLTTTEANACEASCNIFNNAIWQSTAATGTTQTMGVCAVNAANDQCKTYNDAYSTAMTTAMLTAGLNINAGVCSCDDACNAGHMERVGYSVMTAAFLRMVL